MSRGKILLALHESSAGGASLSMLRVVPLLKRYGWNFAFWVPSPSPIQRMLSEQGEEVYGGSRTIEGYSLRSMRHDPGMVRRLIRVPSYVGGFRNALKASGADVAHINSLYSLPEAVSAKSRGVPIVIHAHEMLGAGAKGRVGRFLIHRLADRVVGVSEECVNQLGGEEGGVELVHECAPLIAAPIDRSGRRGTVSVGTVGVISQRKGTDLFVQACTQLKQQGVRITARIVGGKSAPLDDAWAEQILSEAAANEIDWTASTDVPAFLEQLDIFVLPSREDPFPIAVLEAMGSGLPVVGTDIDGIAEQITPAAGLLVPVDRSDLLAAAISSLVDDPGRRAELARGARQRAEEFPLERQASALNDLYEKLFAA